MLTQERYNLILALVNRKKTAAMGELVEITGASESSVRRDLLALQKMGMLKRVHGGAMAIQGEEAIAEEGMDAKVQKNILEKERIAQCAAALVQENDFIFVDAGTSTEKLIDCLDPQTKAIFVTNGIEHGKKLIKKGIKTYIIGGKIRPLTEAIVGTEAVDGLKKYNFTKCFIGTNGVTVENGYTTPDLEEAALKREAMRRSYMKIILADHTKFGKVQALSFGEIGSACIITDQIPDKKFMEATVIKEAK